MSLHKRVTKSNYVCFAFMLFTMVYNVREAQSETSTAGPTTTSEMTTQSTMTTSETTTSDHSTTIPMNGESTTTETLESTSVMSTETTSGVTTLSTATSITTTTGTQTTTTDNTDLSTTTDSNNTSASTEATSTTGSPTTVNSSNEMTTTTTIDSNISTQDTTTVESDTGTTSQSSSTVTGDSVLTTTESLGSTTESDLSVTSAPTVMEPNMTSTETSVEPTAMTETTNITTGTTGTTPITITIEGITTESTSLETSTQQSSTTIATTTTTKRTTTTSYQVEPFYPDTENAVLDFTFELKFTDCGLNKSTIENRLASVSNTVDGCKYIRVKTINSCVSGRRKRSASSTQVSVEAEFGIDAQAGTSAASNVSDDLYFSLSTVQGIDVAYLNETKVNLTVALTSQEICDAEVCRSAVIGRPGFVCVSEMSQNNTQRCKILYYCDYKPMDCGNNGQCYVETDIRPGNVSYTSKCRCTKTDYFRYEGTFCSEKVMTWELAVIISISASGALILVLLFIIIILCCRNATNSGDVSFEESELMYTQSGNANTNQYKNGRNSGDSLKGVENRGYMEVRERPNSGSNWKPEDSANT